MIPIAWVLNMFAAPVGNGFLRYVVLCPYSEIDNEHEHWHDAEGRIDPGEVFDALCGDGPYTIEYRDPQLAEGNNG